MPSSPLLALACRGFQTSSQVQDVDSAAKFIGAGAATVGVAGKGNNNNNMLYLRDHELKQYCISIQLTKN